MQPVEQPLVSVIVPNYNHSDYLQERISSVLAQTYPSFELLILDDCSTDNSKLIIEKFRDHPKVSAIIYNSTNSGSTFHQWKKGISLSKGRYLWIAESDDVADKTFLEKLLLPMIQDTTIGLSFCQSYRMNETGEITGTWEDIYTKIASYNWKQNFTSEGKAFITNAMLLQNSIPNASAVVFNRKFLEVENIDTGMTLCGDWLVYVKQLLNSNVQYISEPLNYFRYHQNKGSIKNIANFNNVKEVYIILNYIFGKIPVAPQKRKTAVRDAFTLWWNQSAYNIVKMYRSNFSNIYKYAIKVDPSLPVRLAYLGSKHAVKFLSGRI